MPRIPLGPFHLVEPIARGGMGAVWRAVHVEQGVNVAVKVISARAASEARYVANLRNEVRAATALDHPGTVVVLDQGEIDAAASRATGGELAEGSPFLAMEYASGGSLATVRHPLPWRELKAILLTVLDALAHAHARGVIHRDIKASNVLVCTDDDPRPGLKLSDFGIAHALDWQARSGIVENTAGTLHYMAPEQLLGHWRDQGPWTDLYSLGCLAWRLATGRVPFTGLKGSAVLRAQLYHDPPAFTPLRPVPTGFEAWLRALLSKDPWRRHQRAADAAWALLGLDDPGAPSGPDTVLDVDDALEGADPFSAAADDVPTASLSRPTRGLPGPEAPPIPASWRRPKPPPPPLSLLGAGLGLYGLRRVGLVGREEERTHLWDALRAVHRTRAARYVLVRGAAGVGKSRLVAWFCERAHELGAAHVLRAAHGAGDDPGDALSRMISRELRCGRLARVDVMERVDDFLAAHGVDDEDEALSLTELIAPADRDTPHRVRLASAGERRVVARRFLERLAQDRPVIAWFDDAHWSSEALAFTEHLLDQPDVPVLVVHTVRQEALDDDVAERLDALLRRPDAGFVELGPLPMRACTELVRELLQLDGDLAARVEERCGGNPLFAVQLVGDWVQRGVLELGPTGFVLRPGADVSLPDDLHEVWAARVAQLLHDLPAAARLHLERAAALGLDVDEREWHAACETGGPRRALSSEGLRVRAELVDRLLSRRLAEETDRGWRFVHGMLRECLERSAREAGRWAAHNRACAEVLARAANPDGGTLERIGRHRVEAGELEAALGPLLDGVSRAWSHRGVRPALALLSTCEHVLAQLSTPGDDPRWTRVWTERARLLCLQGDVDEAADHARRAVDAARANGWTGLLPHALYEVARAEMGRYRHDDAVAPLEEVRRLADATGDTRLLGRSLMALGIVAGTRGRADAARELLGDALRCFEDCGDDRQVGACLGHLGTVALRQGHPEQAGPLLDRAVALAEKSGDRISLAEALNARAEVHRSVGDADAAVTGYERAHRLYASLGSWQAELCRLNVGLVHLQQARWRAARREIASAMQGFAQRGERALLGACHAMLLPCVVGLGAWSAWERHLDAARALLDETRFADADTAWAAQLAGDLASEAGHGIEAVAAYALARDQLDRVGASARRDAVAARIASLTS